MQRSVIVAIALVLCVAGARLDSQTADCWECGYSWDRCELTQYEEASLCPHCIKHFA